MDGSPFVRSYLRFNVQNFTGRVMRATLRIFANSAASSGCVANIVGNNTWAETALTYNLAVTTPRQHRGQPRQQRGRS
jgi:hypothetical protein